MPPKKIKTEESIYKIYFDLTEKYEKQYGKKSIVLLQVGSFFEIYALRDMNGKIIKSEIENISQICQFAIAEKKVEYEGKQVLMSGFGVYRLDFYIQRLTENNITTIVYNQKKEGTSVVSRDLYGIYSPGTFIPYDIDSNPNLTNNVLCVWLDYYSPMSSNQKNIIYGISTVNVFTGETTIFEHDTPFLLNPTTFDELERYISVINPSEVIIISKFDEKITNTIIQYSGIKTNTIHKYILETDSSCYKKQIIENCEKQSYISHILSTFFGEECYQICNEFQLYSIATQSYCFLMHFIQEHNPDLVRKIALPIFNNTSCRMVLANHTLKQLNIIDDNTDDSKNAKRLSSVLSFLNNCCTSMGKRLFNHQLTNPTFNQDWLDNEYKMIGIILEDKNSFLIEIFRKHLNKIRDLEKICRQIVLQKIYPTSIFNLYKSILEIREMNSFLSENPELCEYLCSEINDLKTINSNIYINSLTTNIVGYIDSQINIDKCNGINSMTSFDENIFKEGISQNLDKISREFRENIERFDKIRLFLNQLMRNESKDQNNDETDYIRVHETEKSGSTLQITKKRILILKPLLEKIAVLKNNEKMIVFMDDFEIPLKDIRFISPSKTTDEIEFPQLTRIIKKIVSLKESMSEEISKVFSQFLRDLEKKWYDSIENLAKYIAKIDVLQSKAYSAIKYNYTRPVIDNSKEKSFVSVCDLRHLLIEHINQNEIYVTNDIILGIDVDGVLLYGTNAVGKTSFIRALGICVIMAQAGMFVPCSSFIYKPYTAIFSRILGNDNIFKGLSTFAVEMSELRIILRLADENSLILGDELCTGTETESALSIFTAGLMNLHEKKSTFLFATHFHEICRFDEIKQLNRMVLKHMSVHYDRENKVLIYDRKLKNGTGNRMYGLEVCKSLYLEEEFLEKAYEIRSKYFDNTRGELSYSPSIYNINKIRGKCELCNDVIGTETHHISPQKSANDKGFIGTFHKNHSANLATVCEKCHNELHNEKKSSPIRKKTIKDVVL
jgi:DNA mismatch repair protein MutS